MPFDATPICTVSAATPGPYGGDTSTGDATGATLLVCETSYYAGNSNITSVVDNFGNVFTARATHKTTGQFITQILWDCVNVTHPVGPGWKVTATGASFPVLPSLFAQAWKTSLPVTPFDDESGAISNSTASLAPGSKTPSVAGCLIIAAVAYYDTSGSVAAVGGGFTKLVIPTASGATIGGGLAYLVQGAAAPSNPAWSNANACDMAVGQVIYKPGAAPPPPDVVVRTTQLAGEVFRGEAAAARVTQAAVELWTPIVPPVRVTQHAVELYDTGRSRLRVTQVLVELWTTPGLCPDLFPRVPACSVGDFPRVLDDGADVYPALPAEGAEMDASTFVVNMALQEIGISKPIGSLAGDSSQEAICARLIFSDVVDTVLRDHPWKFATEYAVLSWLAGSLALPVNADWTYTFALPDDCVRVRRVCDPAQQRRFTTAPVPFDLRANSDGLKDVLMCNEPGAGLLPLAAPPALPSLTIEYTKRLPCPAQVNDAQFREALTMKLAARLAKALARDSKDADRALRNYNLALPKGQTQHANDNEVQRPVDAPPDWIQGR